MVEIIALQQYTDKYISLYQGEIRNISQDLANRLVEEGIVAFHQDEGGGDTPSRSGALTLNARWAKKLYCFLIQGMSYDAIKQQYYAGIPVFIKFCDASSNFYGKYGIVIRMGIDSQTSKKELRVLSSTVTSSSSQSPTPTSAFVTFRLEESDNTIRSDSNINLYFIEN